MSLILFLAVSTLVYLLTTTLYLRFHPLLRALPGPPLAKWTNLWRFVDALSGQSHATSLILHEKYGPIVRIGPNAVSISDPAAVPQIYNSRGDFTKTGFYPLQSITWQKRQRVNVFSTRDERQHREMKRVVAGAYTSEALLRMEGKVDECGELLMGYLRRCADSGRMADLGSWLLYYAFDVVGEITFSEKLGFLETGADVDGMIGASGFMMMYFASVGQIPWLHNILLGNPLLPYLIPGFEAANTGTMFTHRAMTRRSTLSPDGSLRMKEGCEGEDMLSRWAALRSRDPDKMGMTDVMVALATNIFAGADTTAISLRAVLYYLMKNPSTMAKAVAEIDAATREGKLSESISDRESRSHLPYINATIKEALRMHPAVGQMLERHVPPQGTVIGGHDLPAGTIVGVNPWVVHYDLLVYPEPEKFRPERWLESGKEELAAMERSFFAFGAGKRVCLGRELSMIEMRKVVPRILGEFELELEEGKQWKVRTAWFAVQGMPGVRVKVRRKE